MSQAEDLDEKLEESVLKIQRAARTMLSRKAFRISLYKLILIKNIVENKAHKEKMAMLFAFEQMIINTEEEYYEEGEEGEEGDYGDEFEQEMARRQIQPPDFQ